MPAAAPDGHAGPGSVGCRLPPCGPARPLLRLLGPRAVSLTYALGGRARTITPAGPEGAYLIVTPFANPRRAFLGGGKVDSLMPRPWSSPIVSIAYDDGTVCRIANTQPVTLKGQCTPPGYRPVRVAVPHHVAAAIHAQVVSVPVRGRSTHRTRRAIRVSFRAPVAITSAASAYEVVEDTSSPEAVFVATPGDVAAGQTVSWLLPVSTPGVYSGRIVLGLHAAAPYPIYTYAPGPLAGRFRIRVSTR